ncbi:hypothetical protein DDN27_003471 [Vibrio cholerae]
MSNSNIEKTEKFFERAKERGASIQTFTCSCGYINKALAPSIEGEVWDSMTFCPKCDKAYFKKVTTTQCEVEAL